MNDFDEGEMEGSVVHQLWESFEDEFIMFEHIDLVDRPCSSRDVCAFILLDRRFPDDKNRKMVSAAEHDQIWLRIKSEQFETLSETDVLYLVRCGVFHDDDTDSLGMFV